MSAHLYAAKWWLQPRQVSVIIAIFCLSFSVLLFGSDRVYTSKVSWRENVGAPLPFLTVFVYAQGPCPRVLFTCPGVFFDSINPINLLVNFASYYIIAFFTPAFGKNLYRFFKN
jgi:hypothetical protein